MVDPALVSIISACTALTASVTGPMVTLYVARAQIRATVRSANRQKWIEEFRETIAALCGQIAVVTQVRNQVMKDGHVAIAAGSDTLHHFERLIFTATKVRLMVNPTDTEHRTLVGAIDDLLRFFRTAPSGEDVQDAARERSLGIAAMSLAIIRNEWLRVQRGA